MVDSDVLPEAGTVSMVHLVVPSTLQVCVKSMSYKLSDTGILLTTVLHVIMSARAAVAPTSVVDEFE